MEVNLIRLFFISSALNLLVGKISILLGLPSYLFDVLGLLIIILLISNQIKYPTITNNFLSAYIIFIILSSIFVVFKLLTSISLFSSISSIYRIFLVQIFFLIGYRIKETLFNKVIRDLTILCSLFSLIAIIQFIFWEKLPPYFVSASLKDNRLDGIMFGLVRGIRSNGLFGNPLELGVFSVLIIYFNQSIKSKVILPIFALISTLSRAGFISFFIIYIKKFKYLTVSLVLILFYLVKTYSFQLGIFSRLLFLSDESAESSSSRVNYIDEIFNMKTSELLFGNSLGATSARFDTNTTLEVYDGYFLNIIAEYGFIYFIIWLAFFIIILMKLIRKSYLTFSVITLFFCMAGSTFLHPTIVSLFYLFAGLAIQPSKNNSLKLIKG